MKDPNNCPYCEAELQGSSRAWGLSPEGWNAMKQRHDQGHINDTVKSVDTNVIPTLPTHDEVVN